MKKKMTLALLLILTTVIGFSGCLGNDPVVPPTPIPTPNDPARPVPTINVSNANASAVLNITAETVTFDAGRLTQIYAKETTLEADHPKFGLNLTGQRGGYEDANQADAYIYVYDAQTAENADKTVKTIVDYYLSVYNTLDDIEIVRINGHDAVEIEEKTNSRVDPEDRYTYVWANGNAVIIVDGNIDDGDVMRKFAADSKL